MNDHPASAALPGPGGDVGRLLRRIHTVPLVLVAIAIVLTVVFGDLPGAGRSAAVLQDSCHTPAFAALSLIVFTLLARRAQRHAAGGAPRTRGSARVAVTQSLAVVAVMLFVGIATELWQGLVGRDAEIDDVVSDVVGAGVVASIWVYATLRGPSSPGARLGRLAALLLGAALVTCWLTPLAHCGLAYWTRDARFPVLAQFQSPRDLYFVSGGPPPLGIVRIQQAATADGPPSALRVAFDRGTWPGMTLSEPVPDWRGFQELLLDLSNPGTAELALRLRISDRAHNGAFDDRFNTGIALAPLSRTTLHIPLDSIAHSPRTRSMDMSRIAELILFRDGAAPGQAVLVHRIWLR